MEWITTTQLLERLRDFNDQESWELLVGNLREPVQRFCAKLGLRPADAEDAAQEALVSFARAFREGRYDRERGRLRDWLFGIAYRQALVLRKKHARNAAHAGGHGHSALLSELPDQSELSASWDEEWNRAVLQRCLVQVRAEVEPRTMAAFEGVVFGAHPAAEVAAELGISRNAVFLAKHRIVKRIHELQTEFDPQ